MRKIVAAIIVVCFVQIGFQLYTIVEQTNFSYRSVSTSIPATSPRLTAGDIVEVAFNESSSFFSSTPESRPVNAVFHRSGAHSRPMTARAEPKALFPTVVITVPPQQRYEFAAYSSPVPKPAAPPTQAVVRSVEARVNSPKKRSALASVVRKPYDLLKFVASKLH